MIHHETTIVHLELGGDALHIITHTTRNDDHTYQGVILKKMYFHACCINILVWRWTRKRRASFQCLVSFGILL